MTTLDTRFDDEHIKEAIQQLIIEEEDPKEKLRLLMLLQLNSSLVSNVIAVRNLTGEFKEHRLEFEAHLRSEEKIINTGRGALWAVVALIGFIQLTTGYIFNQHMNRFDTVYSTVTTDHTENIIQSDKIKVLDEKFNRVLDKLDKK